MEEGGSHHHHPALSAPSPAGSDNIHSFLLRAFPNWLICTIEQSFYPHRVALHFWESPPNIEGGLISFLLLQPSFDILDSLGP